MGVEVVELKRGKVKGADYTLALSSCHWGGLERMQVQSPKAALVMNKISYEMVWGVEEGLEI